MDLVKDYDHSILCHPNKVIVVEDALKCKLMSNVAKLGIKQEIIMAISNV